MSPSHSVARDHPSRETTASRRAWGVWLPIGLIEIYRRLAAPVLPPSCRFVPSCSHYAQGALRRHGLWRGARLAVGRILRCGPWSAGGFDPVP